MREHLIYIDGLQSGDRVKARESCRAHMATARATLMSSIGDLERKL
jgi:DNA-binding GntR family transcriptional regulator